MTLLTSRLQGYWEDKRKYPWHRIYSMIEKHWEKAGIDEDLGDVLILIRDAVFGALDIHSLSLAIDTPTADILDILLKAKDWSEGKKHVRNYCAKEIKTLVSKMKLDYLDDRALARDGFGYLVEDLRNAQL